MPEQSPQQKDQAEWDRILRQAWVTTSLERDKTIVALSSAGLALLVTFLLKVGAHEFFVRALLLLGVIGFTSSILAGVHCLSVNRSIIQRELRREPEGSPPLADKIVIWGFRVGILAIAAVGIGIAIFI